MYKGKRNAWQEMTLQTHLPELTEIYAQKKWEKKSELPLSSSFISHSLSTS